MVVVKVLLGVCYCCCCLVLFILVDIHLGVLLVFWQWGWQIVGFRDTVILIFLSLNVMVLQLLLLQLLQMLLLVMVVCLWWGNNHHLFLLMVILLLLLVLQLLWLQQWLIVKTLCEHDASVLFIGIILGILHMRLDCSVMMSNDRLFVVLLLLLVMIPQFLLR